MHRIFYSKDSRTLLVHTPVQMKVHPELKMIMLQNASLSCTMIHLLDPLRMKVQVPPQSPLDAAVDIQHLLPARMFCNTGYHSENVISGLL
ncbi:hypothetical protein Trydic_g16614 [Trypoxylus dichotomus]